MDSVKALPSSNGSVQNENIMNMDDNHLPYEMDTNRIDGDQSSYAPKDVKEPQKEYFTFYNFLAHSQFVLSEDQKERVVFGFVRSDFLLISDRIPDTVLDLCLQFYVCDEPEAAFSGFEHEANLQMFALGQRAIGIYHQQLKYMMDHLASLRSIIQNKEKIMENISFRFNEGIIPQDTNGPDYELDADEIDQTKLRWKAEAFAQRTILENVSEGLSLMIWIHIHVE